MPKDPVGDVRAQLLVIGVEELVIHDLRRNVLPPGNFEQPVEFAQGEHRRLLDEHVLAGRECRERRFEMAVVGGGDADDIDIGCGDPGDRVGAGEALELGAAGRRGGAVTFGAGAGPRRDRSELHVDRAGRFLIDADTRGALEERTVGLVEDHPEADHAGADRRCVRSHGEDYTRMAGRGKHSSRSKPAIRVDRCQFRRRSDRRVNIIAIIGRRTEGSISVSSDPHA